MTHVLNVFLKSSDKVYAKFYLRPVSAELIRRVTGDEYDPDVTNLSEEQGRFLLERSGFPARRGDFDYQTYLFEDYCIKRKNRYYPRKPAPDYLGGSFNADEVRAQISNGAGKLNKRWQDAEGNTFEWISKDQVVEKYTSAGEFVGRYNRRTGEKVG